eukprot:scaffold79681_cov69-Phaeocystis_antarctica.AAC.1
MSNCDVCEPYTSVRARATGITRKTVECRKIKVRLLGRKAPGRAVGLTRRCRPVAAGAAPGAAPASTLRAPRTGVLPHN